MDNNTQYKDISIKLDDGQVMFALINGDLGFLVYLRNDGDPGFSSRNPNYNGPNDITLEYFLNNGQRDEYPLSWALAKSEVLKALEYFKIYKKPPTNIIWNNDSEDGTTIK